MYSIKHPFYLIHAALNDLTEEQLHKTICNYLTPERETYVNGERGRSNLNPPISKRQLTLMNTVLSFFLSFPYRCSHHTGCDAENSK